MDSSSVEKALKMSEGEFFVESLFFLTSSMEKLTSGEITPQEHQNHRVFVKSIQAARKLVGQEVVFPKWPNKGWLAPYLFQGSSLFDKRWDFWTDCLIMGEVYGDIPQITFQNISEERTNTTYKHLETILRQIELKSSVGNSLNTFVEWLLWGFGETSCKERPQIDEALDRWLYENFELGRMQQNPADYFGYLAALSKNNGRWSNPNAFYPTPITVCHMMADMMYGDLKDPTASVCDPCCGTGGLLMAASNYSVNLYGNDIDYHLVRMCLANCWLYMPWVIKPAPWVKSGKSVEPTPPQKEEKTVIIEEKKVSFKMDDNGQMSMF